MSCSSLTGQVQLRTHEVTGPHRTTHPAADPNMKVCGPEVTHRKLFPSDDEAKSLQPQPPASAESSRFVSLSLLHPAGSPCPAFESTQLLPEPLPCDPPRDAPN